MNTTIPMLLVSALAVGFAPQNAVQDTGHRKEPVADLRSGFRLPLDISLQGLGGGPITLTTTTSCLDSIKDRATGGCLMASSTPTPGTLFPPPHDGGTGSVASGASSFVGGGENNQATGPRSTVGGGRNNTASGSAATVGGGKSNAASGGYATVGGGDSNTASGDDATVGGGYGNTASGFVATIGGGFFNSASGSGGTVGGGRFNAADPYNATVGGGFGNGASVLCPSQLR